jgi:putative flippase GtrA
MAHKRTRSQASINKARHFELVRIGEYLVSGGLYFWTGYLVFFLAYTVFGWNLWWAKLISNVIGWVVNYLLQRFWVFKDPKLAKHREEVTFRYAVITLVDFVLDYYIVRGLQIVGISPYLGQFASAGFFTVWNYLWYRSWVFTSRLHRKKKHPAKKPKK